ncbi:MAG: hypothetical protein IBX61_06455 [Thermoleophilia bacterium]|nr:hypothetical protein [Thermoleophilia bacterium]
MSNQPDKPGARPGNSRKWLKPAVVAGVVFLGLSAGLATTLGISMVKDSPVEQRKAKYSSGGYGKFPTYVTNADLPNAQKSYQFAVDYTEELDQIPCFCGCGQHAGHKSVRYCFIERDDPKNENILFDPHGAGCQMCIDLVLEAVEGLENGDSLKDVRARIEEQWKDSIDSMTPTPPIKG